VSEKNRILKAHTIATLKEMNNTRKNRSINWDLVCDSHEELRAALGVAKEGLEDFAENSHHFQAFPNRIEEIARRWLSRIDELMGEKP
jgi:hypothetical protein